MRDWKKALDAATEAVKHIEEVRDALVAEIEKPKHKIEAGALVGYNRVEYRVHSLAPGVVFLVPTDSTELAITVRGNYRCDIKVITPAVVEVGDYVEVGDKGGIVVRADASDCPYNVYFPPNLSPSWPSRSEITVLTKAPKKEKEIDDA